MRHITAAALLLLLTSCAARRAPFEGYRQLQEPAASPEVVRLVFIGDTGAEADGEGSHFDAATRDRLRDSIRAEEADGIFAMGDLIYGVGGPLELVPRCRDPQRPRAAALLEGRLGRFYADLGAPAWLVLGNHDVGHYTYSRQRARCLVAYAEQEDHLRLPAAKYAVDYGLARVVVVDTNVPPKRWDAAELSAAMGDRDGQWTLMVGHHVLQTSFDKEEEQHRAAHRYKAWLLDQQLAPDLWLNGHAHFLQFGVYDDIPAATAGSGSKIRERPVCPGDGCVGEPPPRFSQSTYGYALVELSEAALTLHLKDAAGESLFCWTRTSADPQGRPCPEPAAAVGTDIHLWGTFNQTGHEEIVTARAGEVVGRSAQAGLEGELAYLVAPMAERNSFANIVGMSPHTALLGPSPGPLLEQARSQGWPTPMLLLAVMPPGAAPEAPQAVQLQITDSEEDGPQILPPEDVVRFSARLLPPPPPEE